MAILTNLVPEIDYNSLKGGQASQVLLKAGKPAILIPHNFAPKSILETPNLYGRISLRKKILCSG